MKKKIKRQYDTNRLPLNLYIVLLKINIINDLSVSGKELKRTSAYVNIIYKLISVKRMLLVCLKFIIKFEKKNVDSSCNS